MFALLGALFPLSEIYTFFDNTKISPWLDRGFHYDVSWRYYIDGLSDSVCWVVAIHVLLRCVEFRRMKPLKFVGRVTLAYMYYDLFMYLINHNYYTSYVFGYSCMIVLVAIMYWMDGVVLKLRLLQNKLKDELEIKEAYQ